MTAAMMPARANPETGRTIPAPLPGAGVSVGVEVGISEAPPVVVMFPPTTEETLLKMEEREEMISLVGTDGTGVVGKVGAQSVPVTVSVTQTVAS